MTPLGRLKTMHDFEDVYQFTVEAFEKNQVQSTKYCIILSNLCIEIAFNKLIISYITFLFQICFIFFYFIRKKEMMFNIRSLVN